MYGSFRKDIGFDEYMAVCQRQNLTYAVRHLFKVSYSNILNN